MQRTGSNWSPLASGQIMQPLSGRMSPQLLISNITPGRIDTLAFLPPPFGSFDKSAKVNSFDGFGRKGEKIGQVTNRGGGDDWEIQFIRARIKLKGGESSSWYFERGRPSFIELRTFNIEPAAFIFGRHAFGRKSI